MKIGVFDSGLGGLTIFREIIKLKPQYDYIYFGDNARVPYGGRSSELIYEFTKSAVEFLLKKDCLLVILACNTASSVALRKIQQEYLPKAYPQRKVLGVIRPTVEAAFEMSSKRIGVIGTYTTIASESFVRELKKVDEKIKVWQNACPLLVPIIEEGDLNLSELTSLLNKYLKPLLKNDIDSLILGCTHYGLIDDKIKTVIGGDIRVISQGYVTAVKLSDYLKRHQGLTVKLAKHHRRTYYVTDLNTRYQNLAKLFMGSSFRIFDKLLKVNI